MRDGVNCTHREPSENHTYHMTECVNSGRCWYEYETHQKHYSSELEG